MAIGEKKAQEILTQVKADCKEAENEVVFRLDKWLERMAFYRGLHYTIKDGSFHLDVDDAAGEAREVHNFIPSIVKAAVASRVQHFPNPKIPAADSSQASLARAKATEQLAKSFVDDGILSGEEFLRALNAAAITGGAWLKVYWDPFSGKPVPAEDEIEEVELEDPETGEILTDVVEKEKPKDVFGAEIPVQAFEGRIKAAFVDLFDGWPDPCATTPDEMRFWVHRKVRPLEEMKRRFPKDMFGKDINWETSAGDSAWVQKQSVLAYENYSTVDPDSVMLMEYWRAADEDFPNGMLCVFSGNSILHIGPCPYVPARIPAIFIPGDNIVPGGFYPEGVVEHVIQPQKTLNRAESKIRELMDRMLNPHILVPNESDVDEEIFGEVGGQVIRYRAGYPPHVLHSPEVPSSMFNISASMQQRMKDISTYTEVTQGGVPGRVESGDAIELLKETAAFIRITEVMLYQKQITEAMKQCLYLARQYYPDGRLIRTLGNDNGWTYLEFRSDEYDWDVDLAPEPFSAAPNSSVRRRTRTLEAWQMGLFDDGKPGARDVRRMLGLDNAERTSADPDAHHRSLARMENQQVLARSKGEYDGPLNPVQPFHDNETHLEEHNIFRNSQEYLDLTPEARMLIDEHCEEHEDALSNQMDDLGARMQQFGPAMQQTKQPGIASQAAPGGAEMGGGAGEPPIPE